MSAVAIARREPMSEGGLEAGGRCRNRRLGCATVRERCGVDVPVQYYQSVIGIEVAVTGALLFQVRFFESREVAEEARRPLPSPWLRLLVAVVLGATLYGSLYAIAHPGGSTAAIAVTAGLALSVVPILVGVMPPLTGGRDIATGLQRAPTVALLALYGVAVAAMVVLLND
jgi:hypothetical protein